MSRYNLLQDKLTDAIINFYWRLEHPFPVVGESFQMMTAHYITDQLFHAKVQSMVAGLIGIVQDWEKVAEQCEKPLKHSEGCGWLLPASSNASGRGECDCGFK